MRHFLLPHQRRHPSVLQRDPFPRILQYGPDDVLHTLLLDRFSHRFDLRIFFLGREVFPEVHQAERAICTGKDAFHALDIIEIGRYHPSTKLGQRFSLVRIHISSQRANREATAGIVNNCPHEPSTLSPSRTDYGNDLHISHHTLPT